MTLLELMLALALSALLMIAVGMAIDLHLRALDSQRMNVEEAQLARAVFRSFADDLRGGVPYEVVDFSIVESMAVSSAVNQATNAVAGLTGQTGTTGGQGTTGQTGGGQTGGGQSGTGGQSNSGGGTSGGRTTGGSTSGSTGGSRSTTGQSGGSTMQGSTSGGTGGSAGGASQSGGQRSSSGIATTGGTASMQTGSRSVMGGTAGVGASGMTVAGAGGQTTGAEGTASENIAGGTGIASIPGFYGNQYELQIDVSRLPRLDEYSGLMNLTDNGGMSAVKIPSDVKTIAYYLKTQDSGTPSAATTMLRTPQTGLVRRELDRAVTSFAAVGGGSDDLVTSEKVLAPEVTSLEFQYYDGQAWTTSWDSDVQGGLPVAIEILMGIASAKSRSLQRTQNGNVPPPVYLPADDDLVYRLVVKIPVGRPNSETTTTEETTDPTATDPAATGGTTASGMGVGAMGNSAGSGARSAGGAGT